MASLTSRANSSLVRTFLSRVQADLTVADPAQVSAFAFVPLVEPKEWRQPSSWLLRFVGYGTTKFTTGSQSG